MRYRGECLDKQPEKKKPAKLLTVSPGLVKSVRITDGGNDCPAIGLFDAEGRAVLAFEVSGIGIDDETCVFSSCCAMGEAGEFQFSLLDATEAEEDCFDIFEDGPKYTQPYNLNLRTFLEKLEFDIRESIARNLLEYISQHTGTRNILLTVPVAKAAKLGYFTAFVVESAFAADDCAVKLVNFPSNDGNREMTLYLYTNPKPTR